MLSRIRFDQPQLSRMQREEQLAAQLNHKQQQEKEKERSRSRSRSPSKKSKKSQKDKKEKKEKKHKKKSKSSKKEKKSHKHSHRDKRRKLPDGQEASHADSDSSSDSSSSSDSGSEDESHRHHSSSNHHNHSSRDSSDHPMTSSSAAAPSSIPSASSMQRDSWMMPRVRSDHEIRVETELRDRKEREKLEAQRKIDAEVDERKRQMAEGGLQGKFRPTAASTTNASVVSVGDGGASWRARALQRAKERAVEEGREVGQVVRDRFGDDFNKPPSKSNSTSSGYGAASASSSSMELVETEEEIEAREKREKAKKASGGPPPKTEIGRLMKKPAHLLAVPSSSEATASDTLTSTSTTSSSSSSWRDKIRKNLTSTAAPKTPEGEASALFSTPTVGGQGAIAPSPSPNPSPIPESALFDPLGDSKTAAKPLRFAGELSPETLGMDSALGLKLDPANVEQQLHGQKDIDAALPQFAAGFLPMQDEQAAKATAVPLTTSTPASKSNSSSNSNVPTGASDADLNKLSAQAQIAKLRKNTELYESLTKQIAELKAARVQAEAAKQVTTSASHAQLELLHQKARAAEAANPAGTAQAALHGHLLSHGSAIDERIRIIQSADGGDTLTDSGKQVVMLDTHDAFGRPINYQANKAKEAAAASGMPQRDPTMKNKKLAPNIDAEGNRVAYFADDVKEQSLRELVEKEKLARQSAALGLASREHHDMDRDYAMSIMRDSNFKLAATDEQFDEADFNMSKYDRSTSVKNQKRSAADLEARSKSQHIQLQQKHENLIERCWYCLQGSKEVLKSLIVSIGVRVYLSIPRVNWITEGHVIIVPIEHNLSQTHMEDDVFEEVNYFKKHLVQCFAARNQRCVFLETVHDLNRKRHTVIECIPLDQQQYEEAEIYFVKAINEADEEWAQNKKLIRFTSDKGGVRKAIPKNFSYFSVEFGVTDGGMAHPIEDHDAFPENFGKEVILGMMGESAHMWLRGKRAGASEENRRLQEFLTAWKKFDWTKKLTKNQAPSAASSSSSAAAATTR